ncbi:tRNA-guanine transglycosylase [Chlorella sorokiniana]|uniref:tRNA-guanine transglycosylase n=1 Tax=Chlorella sorokiniana TaxID=3076 RepID=A0A2P6TWM5_CHLSO|nr:tRNA-guanine transglycosylase [Chlorella sorokiniana]|eukprot:PRW58463.1 tRNA-guanine transglycosylase [Chlorella sorokiniana]
MLARCAAAAGGAAAVAAGLFDGGHYAADPGVKADDLEGEPGAMKRAVLSLARERSDILFGLDGGKLKALTVAGTPADDRKTRNAFKRLQASIVEGRHLPPAEGGPAELQDVMRLILSLAQCSQREVELFKPLLHAACALLPDIAAAAAAPPSPEALAAAAEAQAAHQRFRPGRLKGELPAEPARRAEGGRPHTERPDRQRPRQESDREWDDWSGRPRRSGPPGGRGGRGGGRGSGRGSPGGRGGRGGGRGRGSGPQQRQDGGGSRWYSGGSRDAE